MNESWQDTITRISKPVRYTAAAALGFLALFLAVKAIDAVVNFGAEYMPYPNTITVEGKGEATAVPDIASISFSVTETASVVGAAQTQATEKINKALAFLKEAGVEEKDIKTTSYNVWPQYEQVAPCYYGPCSTGNPRITGYQVSQSIEVKIRNTEQVGEILQGIGDIGVQNIYGPNFTVDDEDIARVEARAKAIKDAREKAKVLAKDLGVRLGKVVSFYENGYGYPIAEGYGGAAMDVGITKEAPAPRLPQGEQETSVTVSITYEIK